MTVCKESNEGVLGDPLERFGDELDPIQAKETNGPFLGNANHKEFIIQGHCHIADFTARKVLSIVPKVDILCLQLIVDIYEDFGFVYCEEESVVFLDVLEHLETGDGLLVAACLVFSFIFVSSLRLV